MFTLAIQTIRSRWVSFMSMFAALSLGVALIGAACLVLFATSNLPPQTPERFVAAEVVVRPTAPTWARQLSDNQQRDIAGENGLPGDVVVQLAAAGKTSIDRSFYAHMAGSDKNQIGHPWASAAFASYKLEQGRAPVRENEIVVDAGVASIGTSKVVRTANEQRSYTVVGLVAPQSFESPLFFTDTEAARLSPRVDAVVVDAPVGRVQQIVADRAEVLAGQDRSQLDPTYTQKIQSLNNIAILTSIAGGISGFVALFVIASTFAFAVAQRNREFALLRSVGATPGQIRRMVFSEALLIGVVASLAGCVLANLAAGLFVDWLGAVGIAPPGFGPSLSLMPLLLAFLIGLVVALLGVWAAAYRAGKVSPVESLREAAVQHKGMSSLRWILGFALLGMGGMALAWAAMLQPRIVLVSNIYINILLFTVAGIILLSPVFVPFLIRVLFLPFRQQKGAVAMLARANMLGTITRTSAVIAPIALTLGFILSSLGVVGTVNQAKTTELKNNVKAPLVLTPEQGKVIGQTALQNIRNASHADIAAVVPISMYIIDEDGRVDEKDIEAIDPSLLARTITVPLVAGSSMLHDNSIIVSDSWDAEVGSEVRVRTKDGQDTSLRVAGVFSTGISSTEGYVSSTFAGVTPASRAYVAPESANDMAALESSVREAARDQGVRVVARDDWAMSANTNNVQASWIGLIVTLGVTIIYSIIAISNTILMATTSRLRSVLALQRVGATRRQLVYMVIAEAAAVVIVACIVAIAASALNFVGVQLALSKLVGATPLVIPWGPLGLVVIGSLVVTIVASAFPIYIAFRKGRVASIERRE